MKTVLKIGGIALVVLGFLGMIGVLGPDPSSSILGSAFYFNMTSSWVYLIVGVLGLLAGYERESNFFKWVVAILGILLFIVGFVGLFISSTTFLGMNLMLGTAIFNLALGIWAFWSTMAKESMVKMYEGEKCFGPNCPSKL